MYLYHTDAGPSIRVAKAHTLGKSSLLCELDAKLDQFFWGLLSEGVTPSGSSFRTRLSDQPIGDVLRRHGIAPSPKRSQCSTWKYFIAAHMAVL